MELNYNFNVEYGVFKYDCVNYSSYLKIKTKDIKKIYDILNQLDVLEKQAAKSRTSNCICNGFEMLFDFGRCVKIKNISNWLSIKEEVPIIKKELIKYIKKHNIESVKDIIVKIKSLKKGSSNRIKEELK